MLALVETFRHSPLVLDAAFERHADELPFEVVTPVVVDAGMHAALTAGLTNQCRAAVGTAIDESVQRTVVVTVDDHRGITEKAGDEVPGFRHLGLETQVAPYRPAKDALLLAFEDVRIGEHPVGDRAIVGIRPNELCHQVTGLGRTNEAYAACIQAVNEARSGHPLDQTVQ